MRRAAHLVVALTALGLAACTAPAPGGAPAGRPAPQAPTGYLVGAYYYPWYYAGHWATHDFVGRHLPQPLEPAMGEYVSDDPKVIATHLKWAEDYGIDFFLLSWSQRDSFADLTLRKYFLPALAASKVKQAPYLEFVAYGERDLNKPEFRRRVMDDLRFIGQEFLTQPSVLKVGGRPVLFYYASRILTGDVVGWMHEVRQMYAAMGLNPFIIADEAFWYEPDLTRVKAFDGITAYNAYDWPRTGDAGYASESGFLADVEHLFTTWQAATRQAGVAFVPNAMPGYNDRGVRLGENHWVIPRRLTADGPITGLFGKSIELAKRFTDPSLRMVTITTFNEWHEWTAIEPTRRVEGRKPLPGAQAYTQGFPHDDFGFAYLEQIRDRLGDGAAATAR